MKFMKEREIRGIHGETVNFMENREIHTRKDREIHEIHRKSCKIHGCL